MSAQSLPVYAATDSPRLRYVLDWLLGERLGMAYELYTGGAAGDEGAGIAYGTPRAGCIFVPEEGLLRSGGHDGSSLQTAEWDRPQTGTAFSFDLFSALFFLLSRLEEWNSPAADRHGRFPHTESVLHRKGWLQRPLADEWCESLRRGLADLCGRAGTGPQFSFQPTYDIDIAWSYRHKGLKRTLGGALRDVLQGRPGLALKRLRVLWGGTADPFDAFERLGHLHRRWGLSPHYFVLAALQPSPFDKNISPEHPAMRALIRKLAAEGRLGLHPSYHSGENGATFAAEKKMLEALCGRLLRSSRQHFIRYWIPKTPRFLLQQGIAADYSMGYATINGFRAGTSHPFCWYDLDAESATALRIHPFCFMDSTAHYDLGLSTEVAFEQLRQLRERLLSCGGRLVTVFHNFSLGTDPEWKGWWEAYSAFVAETTDRYAGGTAPVSQAPLAER